MTNDPTNVRSTNFSDVPRVTKRRLLETELLSAWLSPFVKDCPAQSQKRPFLREPEPVPPAPTKTHRRAYQ